MLRTVVQGNLLPKTERQQGLFVFHDKEPVKLGRSNGLISAESDSVTDKIKKGLIFSSPNYLLIQMNGLI